MARSITLRSSVQTSLAIPLMAIKMERRQAPGATNYLGKEKSSGQTNKGEELSLPSSATGLRTASRSRGGVEEHTHKGTLPAREAEIVFCSWLKY